MEYITVESSNIDKVAWENNNLFVQYKSGKLYQYENVERKVFLEMLGARSKGSYMNANVKNKYKYVLVE